MTEDWKLPVAVVVAGALIALAVIVSPNTGPHEIRLSDHERIRIDMATGISQACTTHQRLERCITLSGSDGQFMPYIRHEMRELGFRDVMRAKLRGEE